jgi:flagellar biosynthesis/type III secretory pathway protein FliH
MNKFNESKIYKISSLHTDKIYIGSTIKKYISSRIAGHTSRFNKWNKDNTKQYCSSYILYQFGNVEYELLEIYNCNNKEELTKRERYYMELHSNIIVNAKKAYRTKEEHKEDMRKWKEEHKEQHKENIKKWQEEHKEQFKQKQREYYAKMKALKATQQI